MANNAPTLAMSEKELADNNALLIKAKELDKKLGRKTIVLKNKESTTKNELMESLRIKKEKYK